MIDQKKLSFFWNTEVPDEFKHFMKSEFKKKAKQYETDIKTHLVNRIDFNDIEFALDWGCGGGLSSRLLSDHCNVIALDIAETSLKKCKEYLKKHHKTPVACYRLKTLDGFIIKEKIDLIFSASVIQHFPSYEYWKEIVAYWNSLQPKCIAIQTRHGDQNKSNEEVYFKETRNYILGLYLTTTEVIDSFKNNYDLKYRKLIDDNYSMYEYFIFKKSDISFE